MASIKSKKEKVIIPHVWDVLPKRPSDIKINYCLATWSGPRIGIPHSQTFLRQHIEHLNTIKHNISQVTVGHPEYDGEDPEFTEYIYSLSRLNDGTPIVVYDVPNMAMSYGQWSRMFELYNQFSHYIFIEDDYVPVKDKFDSILVDMYEDKREAKPYLGFLCGLVKSGRGKKEPLHASISNGISSGDVLQQVWSRFKTLVPYQSKYSVAQIEFSRCITRSGFEIDDYLDQYRSVYFRPVDTIEIYVGRGKSQQDLIMPVQCLKQKKPLTVLYC